MISPPKTRLFLSVFAAFTILLSLANPANAAHTYEETFNNTLTLTNQCTGEVIALTSTVHLFFTVTFDSTGTQTDYQFHVNERMKGTGSFGNDYVGVQTESFTFHAAAGSVINSQRTVNVISKGPAPNITYHYILHVTTNPDGTITASVDNLRTSC